MFAFNCLDYGVHFNILLQISIPITPAGILKVRGVICAAEGPGVEKVQWFSRNSDPDFLLTYCQKIPL